MSRLTTGVCRYMHELRQVKRECERRLAQLGGPDYRTAESGSREQAGGHTDGGRSPDQLGERQPKGSLTKIIGSIGGTIGNIGGTIKGTLKEVMVLENIEDASHADSSLISLPEIIGSIGLGYFMEYELSLCSFHLSAVYSLRILKVLTKDACG